MTQQRMPYIDNLRLLVIVLVVCMHAAVTYSGLGDWYYKENAAPGTASILFFAVFQCFLQAFFMGTLFMVAGYFAAASLKSKGAASFLKGRFVRLGIPTLFYMLAIHPLTVYYLMDWDHTRFPLPFPDFYARYISTFRFLGGTGPMWFALALLVFCAVYALVRPGKASPVEPVQRAFPARMPVMLALASTLLAFVLRLEWPIGSNVANMQLCYFAQYIILFCFGIAAHGNGWLEHIDYQLARRCLIAAFLGIPVLLAFIIFGGALSGDQSFRGGLHRQSLLFAAWESFTGVFMSIGLAGVLRRRWNTQGELTRSLSASGFAVYMFHAPILVLISQLMRPLELPAIPKFLLVFAVALPVCFLAARIIRATPLLRDMTRS